jgi:hypothetical protein
METTMKAMTVDGFRREVERRRGGRRRGAPRYSEAHVEFAVAHVRAARSAGRSLHAAATELGLNSVTLGTWLKRTSDPSAGRLREVVVSPAPKAPVPTIGLEITTPCGHVVRGLGVAEAAALLRALR